LNRPSPQWTYLALSVFVAVFWLVTLSLRPLFNTDEGRYAEIPREMLASGDWVIPHLNGLAYLEKPPLQYWASAISQAAFGSTEFGARLYSALCALLCVLTTGLAARRARGPGAGWRATAVLASMLLFLCMGQLLTLDMSLTLYTSLALSAFLAAQGDGAGRGRGWMLLAWAAAGLGVLTKGPVAVLIPAATLACYSLYARDGGPWRRLHAAFGLPLFLAITLPWFWLAARRQADFLEFFFVHEHLSRYLTSSADREQPWWFFGAVFVVGTLPWTLPALRSLARGWRRPGPVSGFDAALFLRIWVLFVVAFFSISDSKLIPYILPALPALALLIAGLPDETLERDVGRTALATIAIALLLGGACWYAPGHLASSARSPYFLALVKPLAQIAVLLTASGLYVLAQRRRGVTRSAVFLGAGWCLSGLLMVRAAAAVAPVYSGIELARALPEGPGDVPVYSVATYDQSLPFYWRRTVQLVAYRGELDYGLRLEPEAELSETQFRERWSAASNAYAVMDSKTFDELQALGVPMREVARDANRVLVARR
jgi:4-amino-4-deoxy-L-arabinose transferase-like glycosyltransferase